MLFMKHIVLISLGLVLLSACGRRPVDRAISGGAIGAGVGAVAGAVVGGNPGTGAVVGGVVGAAAGGLTTKRSIYLGKPIWRQ
jgi:hypothetical protein